MNFIEACNNLYLTPNERQIFTKDIIKRAYYKQALKYHPDKGGDAVIFQKKKDSYDVLMNELMSRQSCKSKSVDTDNSIDESEEANETYESMLVNLVEYIIKNKTEFRNIDKVMIKTTLKSILQGCGSYSIKLFEQLDLDKCRSIYTFLSQNPYLSNLNEQNLKCFKEIIQNKMKNNNVILLNPSLNDLLNDNIYKLEVDDDTHYIPLWHDELIINDMIVKSIPDIDNNTTITKNNDIIIKHNSSIKELFDNGYENINIDGNIFKILSNDIKITKHPQFIVLKNRGKLIPNKNNLYDTKRRGNVIIELTLCS